MQARRDHEAAPGHLPDDGERIIANVDQPNMIKTAENRYEGRAAIDIVRYQADDPRFCRSGPDDQVTGQQARITQCSDLGVQQAGGCQPAPYRAVTIVIVAHCLTGMHEAGAPYQNRLLPAASDLLEDTAAADELALLEGRVLGRQAKELEQVPVELVAEVGEPLWTKPPGSDRASTAASRMPGSLHRDSPTSIVV
jgi:hypothetical protein